MRCRLSSVKCCCPHLSPDPASPGVCVSISHLQIFTRLSLNSTSVLEWSYFPVSISWCPSLLSNVSRARPFFCPASSLTLQGTIDPDRDAVAQHMWLSPHPNPFPHLNFFSLMSPSLVILPPWTSGTDGKRRSWTPVPPCPPTHPGHRLTSALTSRPSAPTRSRLPSRLPVAVKRSGSRWVCLPSKCPRECRAGCWCGRRLLFLEMMSK